MAKDAKFNQQLKKLRDRLRATIDERSRRLVRELSFDITQTFVDRASKKLLKYATPQDSESMAQIQSIADNMKATGSVATIPMDEEGLTLFLEYGTGFTYGFGGNPDATSWVNAIHGKKYRYHNGRLGFFFTKKNNNYLDVADEYPVAYNSSSGQPLSYVKPYPRKGTMVRGYWRRVKSGTPMKIKHNSVFSTGLRPIRFIYSSKREIIDLIDETKSKYNLRSNTSKEERKDAISYLRGKLEELRNAEV